MEIRKLSQLLADYEKTADETKNELAEIKATMIINFDGRYSYNPKLLDGTEKTASQMFMKIIDHFYGAKEAKSQSENNKLLISDIISRLQSMQPKVKFVEFDETRKNDYLYCVEWGIMKGQYIEQGVYDRYITELNTLKS